MKQFTSITKHCGLDMKCLLKQFTSITEHCGLDMKCLPEAFVLGLHAVFKGTMTGS